MEREEKKSIHLLCGEPIYVANQFHTRSSWLLMESIPAVSIFFFLSKAQINKYTLDVGLFESEENDFFYILTYQWIYANNGSYNVTVYDILVYRLAFVYRKQRKWHKKIIQLISLYIFLWFLLYRFPESSQRSVFPFYFQSWFDGSDCWWESPFKLINFENFSDMFKHTSFFLTNRISPSLASRERGRIRRRPDECDSDGPRDGSCVRHFPDDFSSCSRRYTSLFSYVNITRICTRFSPDSCRTTVQNSIYLLDRKFSYYRRKTIQSYWKSAQESFGTLFVGILN